jgi:hypothetical protein
MARGSRKDKRGSQQLPGEAPPPQLFDPQAILAALKRHGVAFVVIGAYAAVTQGWSDRDALPRLEALLQRPRGRKP